MMVIRNPKKASSFRNPRERAKGQNIQNKTKQKTVTEVIINGEILSTLFQALCQVLNICCPSESSPQPCDVCAVTFSMFQTKKQKSGNLLKATPSEKLSPPREPQSIRWPYIHTPQPAAPSERKGTPTVVIQEEKEESVHDGDEDTTPERDSENRVAWVSPTWPQGPKLPLSGLETEV